MVLFGLLLSLSILNEVVCDCNYFQNLGAEQTYYAYNPNYPHYDQDRTCTWKLNSSYEVIIQCSIDIPSSNHSYSPNLSIQFGGNTFRYCGNNNFTVKVMNPIITFDSRYSKSKFVCSIQTEKPDKCNCQCGWKKNTRIVGGKETGINEYPYMAGIYSNGIYCGCTIISPRHVVTAAFCLKNRDINLLQIVVGEHHTGIETETNATRWYKVKWCKLHSQYNNIHYNDIAVCEINDTITYSDKVGPVCLPFQQKNESFDDKTLTALGWGLLGFGNSKAPKLQKVDVKGISLDKCAKFYNVSEGNMCTFTKGKDTCQMDSGGPLLWYNPETRRYILVGIITGSTGCASDEPSIETRVGYYIDWIKFVTPGEQYCTKE